MNINNEDPILSGDPTIARVKWAELLDETTALIRLFHPESGNFSCKVTSSAKLLINNIEVNEIYNLWAIVGWLNDSKQPIYFKVEWASQGFHQVIEMANFLEEEFLSPRGEK